MMISYRQGARHYTRTVWPPCCAGRTREGLRQRRKDELPSRAPSGQRGDRTAAHARAPFGRSPPLVGIWRVRPLVAADFDGALVYMRVPVPNRAHTVQAGTVRAMHSAARGRTAKVVVLGEQSWALLRSIDDIDWLWGNRAETARCATVTPEQFHEAGNGSRRMHIPMVIAQVTPQ